MVNATRPQGSPLLVASTLALLLFLIGGCAFTPKPVVLFQKPSDAQALPPNNLRIALKVSDGRPGPIQTNRLIGIMRNTYMIPTSFVFLANSSDLTEIVAFSMRNILQKAGYTVVRVTPPVPDALPSDKLEAPSTTEDEQKAATKGYSDTNRADLKIARDKEGVTVESEADAADRSPGWIEPKFLEGVDAMVEVKIDKFSSDVVQAIVAVWAQGWSKLKVAALAPNVEERKVLWGKAITGFGTSGPRMLITEDTFIIALNMAYWTAMNELEKIVRSEEFLNELRGQAR